MTRGRNHYVDFGGDAILIIGRTVTEKFPRHEVCHFDGARVGGSAGYAEHARTQNDDLGSILVVWDKHYCLAHFVENL